MEASNSLKEQPPIIEDDDLETVLLCQKGDVEAFGVLVDRHQKKMLNVAYRMIGDYEEACDVVQEAFLAAFRSVAKFRREARFSTWLYGIVVNCAKNRLIELKQRRPGCVPKIFSRRRPPAKKDTDAVARRSLCRRTPSRSAWRKRNWKPGCRNASASLMTATGKFLSCETFRACPTARLPTFSRSPRVPSARGFSGHEIP